MATMGSYCKAYPLARLQAYPNWREKPLPPAPKEANGHDTAADSGENGEEALDERYLFVQENLIVTDGIYLDENIVFDEVTPEWEEFCRTTLAFEVPEINRASADAEDDDVTEEVASGKETA